MSSSRHPDSDRYPERSPYRDRRPPTYARGGAYPARGGGPHSRPNPDSNFPPRDVPRGPKFPPVDAPRGPAGPRDSGRGRGFASRGDGPPSALRDAPPLSSINNQRDHNTRDHWRADLDHRDRDFRDRRPSPGRRSPIRDQRGLNIDRAQRNTREGPLSAGSNFSDPPGGYRRGSGRGRGIGRDFDRDIGPRGRGFHNNENDRHHDARDSRDRTYRPARLRSRSRDPVRRDQSFRDDREFERRDRDERRFGRDEESRGYDSFKPTLRSLDTHRSNLTTDSRNLPNTPTGPVTPHSAHYPGVGDRIGPAVDQYSRRSSLAAEPLSAKDARRDSDRNDLIASRAEFSKERYAPRASSPPQAVPAFGSSNVWINPALDPKSAPPAQVQKPVAFTPSVPAPAPAPAPVAPAPAPAPAPVLPAISQTPKPNIPPGLSTAPPTGPKSHRLADRAQVDLLPQEHKILPVGPPHVDHAVRPVPASSGPPPRGAGTENAEPKLTIPALPNSNNAPPLAPAQRTRPPPTGPQAAFRPNASPSFPRPSQPSYASRDASPGAFAQGPRNARSITTSPKSTPVNIPTGPKADRANSLSRPSMFAPPDRPLFNNPRMPLSGGPKSNQWVRPGLHNPHNPHPRAPTIPAKREFSGDDRERAFGTAPKAPKFEGSMSAVDSQRSGQLKPEMSAPTQAPAQALNEPVVAKTQTPFVQAPKVPSPKLSPIETRRRSDVSMPDISPHTDRPPVSAASSVPEVMDESDDDFDLDEDDFAQSEAKYNREKALLESKLVDLSATHLRATTPLQEIMLLSNLNLEHLPRQEPGPESKLADEEVVSPAPVQSPTENISTELLTPKDEQAQDVFMEETVEVMEEQEEAIEERQEMMEEVQETREQKQEVSIAPATLALRMRQKSSADREPSPLDFTSLPYLVSGPPTPVSDMDQDRPNIPDSILGAIRDILKKDAAPEKEPDAVLRDYGAEYKRWRLHVRELDQVRDHEEQDRLPSAEPSLKATTPDVMSAAVVSLSDAHPPTTGRRGRWATEYDFEEALKESVRTAEEERMGKRVSEAQMQWDPEREAVVPAALSAYEAQRRRFKDTNFQRERGQGVFVYHYEPPEDDFTEAEHRVMVQHYKDQYAKKWGKLAEILHKEVGTSRTYKDTINHYYATKWGKEFKHKAKRGRGGPGKRGGRGGRARAAATAERAEAQGDDSLAPLPLTDTGRPRRHAAPTFGTDAELDSTGATPTPGRPRRQTDVEGTQEKVARRGKGGKDKGGRKPKNQLLAAAPVPSPVKMDRKERQLGVKTEEDTGKRPPELPMPVQPGFIEDHLPFQGEAQALTEMVPGSMARPRSSHPSSRPGPSSYWSVTEQNDFLRNVQHFGTDWVAIANHMGTKTQTMIKNQYQRLVDQGSNVELTRLANEADKKRQRGEDLGPPPTPTPAPKRRFESSHPLQRTLAPTPEAAELMKSPPAQTISLPQFSPPHSTPRLFSTIAQAPPPVTPIIPARGSVSIPETSLAALPSLPAQRSPPQAPIQVQHHQHSQPQHKLHHHGPREGYFSDDQPLRVQNRVTPLQSSVEHHSRAFPPQIQPHARNPETAQTPLFRQPIQPDRESRLDQKKEHDIHPRFQHSRRPSQELGYHRQFPSNAPVSTQGMPSVRSTSGAGSPESRPPPLQQSRYMPSHGQPNGQAPPETMNQVHGPMSVHAQHGSRSMGRTPPVKEEQRHYPPPPHLTQPQPPAVHAQATTYTQPQQPVTQLPAPPPAQKPAAEPPRKSNLLSLLNDEPEEPRRKKPIDVPSHTSTPQQQTSIAPPPPTNQAPGLRTGSYGDMSSNQPSYSRSMYTQPQHQPHISSGRSTVDLTNEQAGARPQGRENWQTRQGFHPGQSQAQQVAPNNSPHVTLAQPAFNETRILGNHRSFLSQHNGPRHNPSPPPHSAYHNSPHMHSRTPSSSGTPSHRHGVPSNTAAQNAQAAASASQILQPNPYAQVDPPGSGAQPVGAVGMRPSQHHTVQQREIQGRNEQSQVHNANLPFSNPQTTPSDLHPGHQHIRGPSIQEQYRPRDLREYHEFDPRNQDRDLSREVSQRADMLLREQTESRSAQQPQQAQQAHQELRYQPATGSDRGYPMQRSHTPLARPGHAQHPSLQHAAHPMLPDNNRASYAQRQQEEPSHRYRDPYPQRDERMRGSEDHVAQQREMREREMRDREMRDREMRDREVREREMRDREMRERDPRYREEMMRRDSRLSGPPPPPPQQQGQGQGHHEHRQSHGGGPMDWTSTVNRQQQQQQERWQQQQHHQQQHQQQQQQHHHHQQQQQQQR